MFGGYLNTNPNIERRVAHGLARLAGLSRFSSPGLGRNPSLEMTRSGPRHATKGGRHHGTRPCAPTHRKSSFIPHHMLSFPDS